MTALPPDEVHVWAVGLSAPPEALVRGEAELSPDERERAARFVFPEDRRRFILAHVALRRVLGAYLGRPAGRLAFSAGARGKPSLKEESDAWLRFNLSHSRETALIACARGRDVGVDIEWMRDDVGQGEIVERFFSDEERREWAALPAARRREAFFRGWARKEAYVKALGEGLAHPPDAYSVRLDPAAGDALLGDRLRPGAASAWTLRSVEEVPPGYVAAVAVAGANPRIVTRPWPPE
jgi:4'-phosphopantetheinyl transferase